MPSKLASTGARSPSPGSTGAQMSTIKLSQAHQSSWIDSTVKLSQAKLIKLYQAVSSSSSSSS
ncbi:uncharacterized protein SETTUDRAFT_29326 [Exserohilum turcica Et28A]|uniref:Uncharacterized protein n=1 Tax=Exserohilum turcicum (strain 28A) TaxID=671987 RepID=R0IEF8_EXST2|nr:uncharacterized protein SETTUDRAFT_29326 [Exserohilum turcica Et28A]EOA83665.1 hypothetical protein SETTUDRAFT_29326 [Exserohilum turcica Et28A]